MCPCLHYLRLVLRQPFRKLECQQLAEKAPHADAGVVTAAAPDGVLFSFVITTIWTIQRQLHKAREGDSALVAYFSRNSFAKFVQWIGGWCESSYQWPRLSRDLWRRSTHSS